jgi:outer membrane lipoprotein LolB
VSRFGATLVTIFFIAGCASNPWATRPNASENLWNGRLSLQVQASSATETEQSFSASFELRGTAQTGQLALFNPLGGTVAVLSWQPGQALLTDAAQATRNFSNLDELSAQATGGTTLPIAALFDWLQGVDTAVDGWQADLSQTGRGRLSVQRFAPLPQARLRVVLEP